MRPPKLTGLQVRDLTCEQVAEHFPYLTDEEVDWLHCALVGLGDGGVDEDEFELLWSAIEGIYEAGFRAGKAKVEP